MNEREKCIGATMNDAEKNMGLKEIMQLPQYTHISTLKITTLVPKFLPKVLLSPSSFNFSLKPYNNFLTIMILTRIMIIIITRIIMIIILPIILILIIITIRIVIILLIKFRLLHVVFKDSIQVDLKKVDAITEWPRPTNVIEV